jgi:uncharacterized membrane protein
MPDDNFSRALLWVVVIIAILGIALVVLSDESEAVTSISLSIQGSDTQSVNPGSSATFKINVTNLLTTTTLTVNLTKSAAPTHWTAQLSQTQISVGALTTKSVTLTVGVPSNASADPVGKQITVTATPDFGDSEQITTTTKVAQTFGIQTSTTTSSKHTVGGSGVTFTMKVNNTGNGQDTVSITHSGQPGSWTVTHVSAVTIPALSAKDVTISVFPPASATSGTYQTTIKATSSDGTSNDQTTFVIIIDSVYGLTLSSTDVSKYVTPKIAAYYNLSVTNTGNTADNAVISIPNPPSGWTVLPTSNPIALAPNETKAFQILVTAPSSALAGTQFQIQINATSNGNGSIVRSLSINAVVNQVYDPLVTPLANSKLVAPGGSVTFKINVTNQGNGNDTVDMSLFGVPGGQGWVFNFNPASVTLIPGQTKSVDLTFTIGTSAAFGDNMITVKGTSHGTTTMGTTTIIVSVSQYYDLSLVPEGAATKRVDPGGTVYFNFTVTNTGNGPDDYTFQVLNLASGWVSYFSKTTVYNVPANSSQTSELTVEIPSTTKAKSYLFDVRATSSGNSSVQKTVKNITVIVNQLYSVDLTLEKSYLEASPAVAGSLNLTITNDGSGNDNFTVTVQGAYTSWVTFNRTTVQVAPGTSTVVMATINPPSTTSAGTVSLTFRATSKGKVSVYDEGALSLNVLQSYEAQLTAVESTLNKKPTETASFTLQLKNPGNGGDTFKVNFTSNPRGLASHTLPSPFVSLTMGQTRTFTVTVTVPSGEPVGNLRFVLLATSQNDTTATASIILTVVVDPVYGVNLFSYDPTAKAEPTDNDTLELRVENTGNTQDTFTLKAIGPYYKWVSFEATRVTVASSGEMVVNATITVPDSDVVTTGTYYINITATSTTDSAATKMLELKVTVLHKEDLDVYPTDMIRRRFTDPGGSVTYKVTVKNLGQSSHVVNIDMTGALADWATISKRMLSLSAGTTGEVTVTVKVPDATAPSSVDITITGTFDDNIRRTDTLILTTVVNRVRNVKVELNDTTISAAPGTGVSVILNVNNTGNDRDTYKLTTDNRTGWVSFSPSTVTLDADANQNVTVTFTAEADPLAAAGMTYFNVTATSQGNTSVSSMAMLSFEVEQVYGVKVKAVPTKKSVDPGINANYNVTVTNTGNGDDTFVFTLGGTRKAWGRMSRSQVDLDAGAEQVVVLTVRIPSNQPVEDVDIWVSAASAGGDDVFANVTTTTTINPLFGVKLTVTRDTKAGLPGRWVAFPVKVKNTGNAEDTFNFEVTGDYAAWVATLEPLTVQPGKIKTLDFNITPPSDVENGVYTFMLNASSDAQGDEYDTLELIVDIDVYYGLDVLLENDQIDSGPNATETVLVYVENTGNVNDTFDLRALGLYASWVSIDNETLDADSGETVVATATIVVNATLSANYVIRFEATSRAGGNVSEAQLTISIELHYGVALTASRADTPAAPNTTIDLEVEVENLGNIKDTFDITIVNLPGSLWTAEPTVDELTVPADGEGYFNVTVDVPEGVRAGTYEVLVRATSTVDPTLPRERDTIPLNISIAFNVSATGPEGRVNILPEQVNIVQVQIKNEGLGMDTFKLSIEDPLGDWAVPAATMVTLDPGWTAVVDVSLEPPVDAEAGDYTLKVKATSANDPMVSAIARITLRVGQIYAVAVTPVTWQVDGVQGQTVSSEFTVENQGNGEDTIRLFVITPPGALLDANLNKSFIELKPDESFKVTLRIEALTDATAGTYLIEVEARSEGGIQPAKAMVTYILPAEYGVDVKTGDGQGQVRIDSSIGGTEQFSVKVTNIGNGVDTFELFINSSDTNLPTWFGFDEDEVTISPGQSKVILVSIAVPSMAMAGSNSFEVVATSTIGDATDSMRGDIIIDQDRYVYISSDVTQASLNPGGGLDAVFELEVNNDGNVQEDVTLEITLPSGWKQPTLDPETVTIEPYATATITVTFTKDSLPNKPKDFNSISVKAVYDSEESPVLGLVVNVLQPDIVIRPDDIVLSSLNPKRDDTVTIEVTVRNEGQVPATGLTLTLLVNDAVTASLAGISVSANGQQKISFDWEVTEEGGTTPTIKIRVTEYDKTFTATASPKIQEEEEGIMAFFDDLPFIQSLLIGIIVGLIVGMLLIGSVARKRTRRRVEAARAAGMAEGMAMAGEVEEEEEEGEEGAPEDEEEAEEGDEEAAGEEEPGEEPGEEDVTPVTVQCPKCQWLNKVTTAQRPYEFRCKECSSLLRLSK